MKIKPIYENSILVKFRRGDDVQNTEVVEASWNQVHTLISEIFKDRFRKPKSESKIPATKIELLEKDNIKHQLHILPFIHTCNGKDYKKLFTLVFNISPREARIQFEKAVNNQ